MALYLKYRPQTLTQIIGQDAVKKALELSFKNGKLSHAYLFSGPRGTGKTSTARILAKMVNCLADFDKALPRKETQSAKSAITTPELKPCNKCSSCLSITDGSNLDLIEIDAASNRGIDDIRLLRENVKLAPASARKKIYIIDEVHMLTQEAFNALLKTLEEPPNHVLFILATTDITKLPQTILSRVTRLDFKLASSDEIVSALQRVVEGEKIKIGDDALRVLAKRAEGSFRDGIKLLDQISSADREISIKDIERLLQAGNFEDGVAILEKLASKSSKEALSLVVKQEELGVQVKELTLNLLELLRDLVFIKNDLGPQLIKEEVSPDEYKILHALVENFSTMRALTFAIDKLQNALEKIKISPIPYLPLELAVVEICQNLTIDDRKVEGGSLKMETRKSKEKIPSLKTSDSSDLSKIKEKWTFVLETVKPYNYSLEALLRNVKIAKVLGSEVILEVPYSFHQRILDAPKSRDLLESVLSDILGKSVKVSTVLGSRPQRVEDIANVDLVAEDEIITLASEIFNGKLVD